MTKFPISERLQDIYARLLAHYHPQPVWWRHESLWEIMVGAILTQNTNWRNVRTALENLKRANRLTPEGIRDLRLDRLTRLIRSAGFTTSKPKRLKILAKFLLKEYGGKPTNMHGGDLEKQRAQLLALHGIGPETADAILLFAAAQPTFVVDAYTRRILSRLGLVSPTISYDELRALFMDHLRQDVPFFQEYHALLDTHAKELCTKRAPRCHVCLLDEICPKLYL